MSEKSNSNILGHWQQDGTKQGEICQRLMSHLYQSDLTLIYEKLLICRSELLQSDE